MKKVLILAAHADDDILGCGGTMAKHSDQGDEVSVLFLTNGVGARGEGDFSSQNIDFLMWLHFDVAICAGSDQCNPFGSGLLRRDAYRRWQISLVSVASHHK